MKRLAVSLVILLVATACDRKQPRREPQEAPVDPGGMTFTDPSTGTTVTTGDSVKLPDGWPTSVPIYPGAAVRSAMTTPGAQTVMFATRDPLPKVIDFYKTKAGMTVENDIDLGPQHIIVLKNPTVSVTLSLGQAGGDETTVSLAVTD
jgi:hypothetical protein